VTALLLLATILVPLTALAACLSATVRCRMLRLLWLVPLPGLLAALLAVDGPPLVLDQARLRFTFALDAPSALLLGVSALLWSVAGAYAGRYFDARPDAERFALWWLLTLSGSLGVFISCDLGTFYFTFAVVSLAAFGLVVHDHTERARRAGRVYLRLVVLGEICLLLAFVLLVDNAPSKSIAIPDVMAALPTSPARDLTIGLLLAGFGLKAGLVPLHVWLPLAHPAAPMPASAVLGGAIIKAGIIGLIRFLPCDGTLTDWGGGLAALGLLTAFWGVVIGITQVNPKTVLAYSSASQMGVVTAALGMGMLAGNTAAPMAVAFYASHHVLAKGALFLAVGVAMDTGRRFSWLVLAPALVLALGFGGLPLTGGALAKAAVKDLFGPGLVGGLALLSTVGSTLLMLHFIRCLAGIAATKPAARAPAGLLLPWLGLAAAAVVVPWALFGPSGVGAWPDVISVAALWAGLWPVLLGAMLAQALWRWGNRLPWVPEGDVLLLVVRGLQTVMPWADGLERLELTIGAWSVAGFCLLALAVAFGTAMLL
jgi:formate hydrogenlyase subunit 3/multisubunit Na+/H+ antiporter MnhD subunit